MEHDGLDYGDRPNPSISDYQCSVLNFKDKLHPQLKRRWKRFKKKFSLLDVTNNDSNRKRKGEHMRELKMDSKGLIVRKKQNRL